MRNETVKTILNRRTIRFYKDRQLTAQELQTVLDCAVWAPSGRNAQPCHIRVVQGKELLDRLNTDFKEYVGWDTPAYTNWDRSPVYQNAPTVLFLFAQGDSGTDAGIMAENICIAAASIGLGSCIIGSIGAYLNAPEAEKWKTVLDIPAAWRFLIAVAVGEPDEDPPAKPRAEGRVKIITTGGKSETWKTTDRKEF